MEEKTKEERLHELYTEFVTYKKISEERIASNEMWNICEKIYDFCIAYGYTKSITELALKLGIAKIKVEQYYDFYRNKLAKENPEKLLESEEKLNQRIGTRAIETASQKRKNDYKIQLLRKLLSIDINDSESLFRLIADCDCTISELKNVIPLITYQFDEDKRKIVSEELFLKLKKYSEIKEILRKKEQQQKTASTEKIIASVAVVCIRRIIASGLTIEKFCENNNYSISLFNKCVNYVKEYYPDLYSEYKKRKYNEPELDKSDIETLTPVVIELFDYLHNCKEENIKFDIIDYYIHFGKYNFMDILHVAQRILNNEDLRLVSYFINTNKNAFVNDKEAKRQEREIRSMAFNIRGVEITEEVKAEIINYLNNNNIPVNSKTFSTAVLRYINNTLFSDLTLEEPNMGSR